MTDNELAAIIKHHQRGDTRKAAEKIRRLTRVDCLKLFGTHQRTLGQALTPSERVRFEDFAQHTLETI